MIGKVAAMARVLVLVIGVLAMGCSSVYCDNDRIAHCADDRYWALCTPHGEDPGWNGYDNFDNAVWPACDESGSLVCPPYLRGAFHTSIQTTLGCYCEPGITTPGDCPR